MIATQYINLNMVPSGYPPVVYMSQYDVGRPIGFVVSASGSTPDLDDYTVTIEGTRSDGTAVTAAVTTDGNICAFETTATMTNRRDRYPAQLVVTDSNDKRIASIPITMMVVKAAMDENAEGIEEDRSLYQQYTGTVQSLIATIRTQLNAEASARQSADNTLQSNINAEASTRSTQDAFLQSQIDQLIAPSGEAPSAAEVQNARIGSDGTVYPTLGDAIRTQNSDLKSAITQQNNAQTGLNIRDINTAHYVKSKNQEQDITLNSLNINDTRIKNALTPVWYALLNTDENEILLSENNWLAILQFECRDDRFDDLSDRIDDNYDAINNLAEEVTSLHKGDYDMFLMGLPVLRMFGDFDTMTKDNKKNIEYNYYETRSQLINQRQLVMHRMLVANGTGNCKWQGQSSINLPKKNFTVTFQKPIPHEGWFIGKKAVLKGNYNDASFARNVVSAKLWGDVVHSRSGIETSPILDTDNNELWIDTDNPILIYSVPLFGCVNGGAIDGFPILVEINGEYVGIYDFTIKKGEEELMLFGGNQYEAVIGAEEDSLPVRFKGEALCDGTDFEIEYASDDFTDELVAASINAAINACISSHTEQDYRDTVCTRIDIDSAIDYWIFSMLIQNWDGVTKNYLLVTYDGTKWYFSAYDLDHTFGNCIANREIPKVDKVNTGFLYFSDINRLFYLINRYDSDKVVARYNELIEGALSENNILLSFSKFIGSIPKRAADKETEIWPLEYWSNMQSYSQIINFYRLRKDYISGQVANL